MFHFLPYWSTSFFHQLRIALTNSSGTSSGLKCAAPFITTELLLGKICSNRFGPYHRISGGRKDPWDPQVLALPQLSNLHFERYS